MNIVIKRFFSFVIDSILVFTMLLPFSLFLVNTTNLSTIEQKFSLLTNNLLSKTISANIYMEQFALYIKEYMQEFTGLIFMNIIGIIIFFIIIPYISKGQTIGQKLLDLKMEKNKEKITIPSLVIRNIIVNGLGYMICIILLQPLSSFSYLITLSILGILSIMLVIISIFMILYKQEHLGLQDIISKSQVCHIEVRECKN